MFGAYAPDTRRKYASAVAKFLSWCSETGAADPRTMDALDRLMFQYICFLFDTRPGLGHALASDLLWGATMFVPALYHRLPLCHRAVRSWQKIKPSKSHPPLTWDLTVCVAVAMALKGRWAYGVAALLGFHCLLRNGELMGLTVDDVAFADDRRMGSVNARTFIRLSKAKTGANQGVDVLDPDIVKILRWLTAGRPPTQRLFPGPRAMAAREDAFRNAVHDACHSLGLSDGYVPHSLRHGGATELALREPPWRLEDICLRGRWRSQESAKTYIQTGKALLLHLTAPSAVTEAAKLLIKHLPETMALLQRRDF
jgi:hypothetical protein